MKHHKKNTNNILNQNMRDVPYGFMRAGRVWLVDAPDKWFAMRPFDNCVYVLDEFGADYLKLIAQGIPLTKRALIMGRKYSKNQIERGYDWLLERELIYLVPVIRDIAFEITSSCNMACDYCYNNYCRKKKIGVGRDVYMKFEIFQKSINSILKFNKGFEGVYYIAFMGGEPLLCKDFIYKCLTYINEMVKSRKIKCVCQIATNGTLISDEFARQVKVYKDLIDVQVSVDGIKEEHDRHRHYAKNALSTYDAIVNNIKLLINNEIRVSIQVSIGNWNTNIYKILQAFRRIGISRWNPSLIITGNQRYDATEKDVCHISKSIESIIHNPSMGMKCLSAAGLVDSAVETLDEMYNDSSLYTCRSVQGGHAAVGFDGKFYSCTALIGNDQYQVGDFKRGIDVDRLDELAARYDKTFLADCRRCAIRRLCLGPCLYELFCNGDKPSEQMCQMRKLRAILTLRNVLANGG